MPPSIKLDIKEILTQINQKLDTIGRDVVEHHEIRFDRQKIQILTLPLSLPTSSMVDLDMCRVRNLASTEH